MITNRPSVFIYTVNVDDSDMIREICAGIEEEGLLYEIKRFYYGSIHELSFLAANESILGSGIGIEGKKIGLQLRSIPKGRDVFFIEKPTLSQCRKLGSNAARAIKRVPFIDLTN